LGRTALGNSLAADEGNSLAAEEGNSLAAVEGNSLAAEEGNTLTAAEGNAGAEHEGNSLAAVKEYLWFQARRRSASLAGAYRCGIAPGSLAKVRTRRIHRMMPSLAEPLLVSKQPIDSFV
jgi:hypothetical protein